MRPSSARLGSSDRVGSCWFTTEQVVLGYTDGPCRIVCENTDSLLSVFIYTSHSRVLFTSVANFTTRSTRPPWYKHEHGRSHDHKPSSRPSSRAGHTRFAKCVSLLKIHFRPPSTPSPLSFPLLPLVYPPNHTLHLTTFLLPDSHANAHLLHPHAGTP